MIDNRPKPKKKQLKDTCFRKLGIYINASRIALSFNQRGMNSGQADGLLASQKKIDSIKLLENKDRISLSYKMIRKVRKIIQFHEANQKLAEEFEKTKDTVYSKRIQRNVSEISKLHQSLNSSGLYKPKFIDALPVEGEKPKKVFASERVLVLKYTDLYAVPEDLPGLKVLEGNLLREYGEHISVYEEHHKLLSGCVRFSDSMKAAVALIMQEAVADILKHVIKEAKSENKLKLDIHHFRSEIINQSPYAILFFGSPVLKAVDEYVLRKAEYAELKSVVMKNGTRTSRSFAKSATFNAIEKLGGFLKINDKKKKIWKNISLQEDSISFVSHVVRIFETVRPSAKINISSVCRELVSNLMWQFLGKLSHRFEIHRTTKAMSISVESAVDIFDILLCSDDKSVSAVLERARRIKDDMKQIKAKKIDPVAN